MVTIQATEDVTLTHTLDVDNLDARSLELLTASEFESLQETVNTLDGLGAKVHPIGEPTVEPCLAYIGFPEEEEE